MAHARSRTTKQAAPARSPAQPLLPPPLRLLPFHHSATADAYEEHFVLPDGRVALLTNCGLLLVNASGFAQLDGAAEIGGC